MIRPLPPATRLSAAFGSKLETCPYLLFSALCTWYRTPRFSVRFFNTFQSSWKYPAWIQLRGRLLSRFCVTVYVETAPTINCVRLFPPVFGMLVPFAFNPLVPASENVPALLSIVG